MKTICAVYRSRRNPDTYLYVDHHEGLSRVPEALARELGRDLAAERTLR